MSPERNGGKRDKFKYLSVMMNADGGMGEEVAHSSWGVIGKLWKEKKIYRVVILTVICGSEKWSLNGIGGRKSQVLR